MTEYFRYPAPIELSKAICRIAIVLFTALLIAMILKNKPEDYDSYIAYIVAFFMPPLAICACCLYIGSWSDVGITAEGLLVESFIIGYVKVKWQDISAIKYIGSKTFGVTVVTTLHGLTFFHRIYSILAIPSASPGFFIHLQNAPQRKLINIIREKMQIEKNTLYHSLN